MPKFVERNAIPVLRRVSLWIGCCVLAVLFFSVLLGTFLIVLGSANVGVIEPIIRVTTAFALPVSCLYLPLVIAIKNAQEKGFWFFLVSGALIGPSSIALWSLVIWLHGVSKKEIWYGDPLLGGLGGVVACLTFSCVVGVFASSFYVTFLKALYRRGMIRV